MKQGKKILSILLAVLMIFGCVQVGVMPLSFIDAEAATAASVKSKLTAAVANKIATKGSEGSNAYTYTGDDGSVMAAAEEVYAYATSVRGGTGTTSSRNATTTIMSKVASDTGYTSGNNNAALRRLINPNGTGVIAYENKVKRADRHWAGQDHKYPSLNGNNITKTIRVAATLENVLKTYNASTIDSIPSTILLDVTYKWGHTYSQTASDGSYNWRKGYVCTAYRWNYLNSVTRTVNSQNTTAAGDIKAFNNHFIKTNGSYLDYTVYQLVTTFTPAELTALISANNTAYKCLNSYSDSIKNHFFNMTQIKTFMDNVVYAEKVANALPAIDAFNNAMTAGYDAQDLAGMESMYATLTPHLENLNSYEADVLAYVGENFPGYESFSLDNAKAFHAQLKKDIELYKLREIKTAVDALRATYPDAAAIAAIDTDAEGNYINENLTLLTLDDKIDGYYTALTNGTFTDENIATVFTEGVGYVKTFADETQWEVDYRNAAAEYVNFYDWFIPLTYADLTKYESAVIYGKNVPENVPNLPNAENKRSAYITMYNKYEALIGTPAMEEIFGAGEEAFINVIDAYIASLKACMEQRVADQLDPLSEYVNDTALVIDFSNFVMIKSLINNVDHDLYADAKARGLVNSDRQKIYNALNNLLVKYNAFVESGGLNNFKQNHYHDAENIYTTRYAGDQGLDENGDQIGYPNDVAREGTEDDYVVDVSKVNQTIVKLDSFLVSEDFCSLVGFKDENDNPYNSLSDAIDDIIQTTFFTDDLVNTLVSSLFPMVCKTLDDILGDLSALGVDGISASPDKNAIARFNLNTLSKGAFKGYLDLYIDGKYNTKKLVDVFETLGIYIYPQSFAKKLPAKYSSIASRLRSAGLDWNKLADAEGNIVLDFEWGVTDYNSFVSVIGTVFDSILPLLRTVLTGTAYSQKITNLAYAKAYDMVVKDALDLGFLGKPDISITSAEAFANITLKIAGETLYKDMWIPLMESLGVTDAGYDLSGLGISGAYKFKSISASSSAAQIADAMFYPLLVLIEQLKQMPLQKLVDMLPQLVYTLSFDTIQSMIDAVTIDIHADIEIENFEDIKIVDIFGWEPDFAWLGNLLKDTINGLLPSFDIPLKLSDMVNLVDLLGFEYTNLNELLAFLLETLGMNVELPIINAGEIITCASVNKNAASQGGNGKRVKFTADRADVFYFLLQYIVSAVGDRTFVEDLIEFIAYSEAELTVDTDGDGEPDAPAPEDIETIELPELVYQIINNVHHNPMNALAALVELFVPQEYAKEDIDWVASQYDYAGIDGMNDASIVYLTYGNDWQKSDAEYLIENVDAILESVLEMTGSEQTQINALIQDGFNNILTNDVITGLISVLSSLGTALGEEFIYELIDRELEVDLTAMYDAFGYLFVTDEDRQAAAEAGEEFVEPLKPGEAGYENIYAITATASEEVNEETGETETVITWSYNGTEFVDGDIETFTDLLCEAIKEFAPVLATMLSGDSIGLFDDAIEFLGYENYADSIGIFFEILGIEDVMDQAEYEAYCDANGDVAALNYTVKQLFNWFDGYILEGNTVQKIVELLPNIVYAIESNALSTVLHNLLMPVLIILDTVRPIIDIDLNSIASLLVSDLINYGEINTDVLLQFIEGVYVNDDLDYKWFNIDLGALTLENIISIVDTLLGTNLYGSQLVNPGLKSLCSGIVEYDSVLTQTAYKSTMDAPDALTIVLSAVLEAAEFVTADGRTNGQIICDMIDEGLVADGKEAVAGAVYAAVTDLIKGVSVEYATPDWDYMFETDMQASEKVSLPEHSIVYLDYTTDWTEDVAVTVEESLNDVITLILDETADGNTIAQLLNAVLQDNLYTEQNLVAIVELVVNAICALDENLRNVIDVVLDTDIASWFAMCETVEEEAINEETGETETVVKYVCNKTWGIDEAAEEDKKDLFVAGLREVLAPANELLAWLFFGDGYEFFTGTEKNADGTYKYNDIIVLNGGYGYAYGLAPIFEALGCTVKSADAYKTEGGAYDAGAAVEDMLNALLAKIDEISADPVHGALDVLVNVIYFINADGLTVSVKNLLAPVNALVEKLAPVITDGDATLNIESLLADVIGFDISDLSMAALLQLAMDNGLILNDKMLSILCSFYVGELSQFTAANGNYAYRMSFTDEEDYHDMLTIVLAFAIELLKLNHDLFSDLLGEDVYNAIVNALSGCVSVYAVPDWAYMYEDIENGATALEQLAANGFPAVEFKYLAYNNDWDEDAADAVYENLDEVIALILDSVADGNTIAQLLAAVINDSLYTDDNLDAVVELIVNAIAGLDSSLCDLVGVVLDADISAWFAMCTFNAETEQYECTRNWGVDAADDKKAAFMAGLKETLAPAEKLLSWLFFGGEYHFLRASDGEVLITLLGGDGYEQGLIPLFEALGCTLKTADAYKDGTGNYLIGAAVEDMINTLLALIDKVSANPAKEIVDLIPNLLYFINANGLSIAVGNLISPINAVLAALRSVAGDTDLQTLLKELIHFDLHTLDADVIFDLLETELGFASTEEMMFTVKNIHGLGVAKTYTSVNGNTAWGIDVAGRENDVLTVILSYALEAFRTNEEVFANLLGEENYRAVYNLIRGAADPFVYREMNWAYMYEGEDALAQLAANNLPARTGDAYEVYTKYQNNWNKATAEYVDEVLDALVKNITDVARNDGSSVGQLLDNAISKGLYQDSILNSLIEMVVELLVDYEEIVAAAGVLLGAEKIADWFSYCDISTDANGETVVVCNKDWGIDSAVGNDAKRTAFVEGFVTALEPAYRLLAWLLFAEDYTFFNGTTNEPLITLTGAMGYDNAFVPLLEGVGAKMPGMTGTYADGQTAIKSADDFRDENGNIDMAQVVRDVFSAVTDWLYVICGDLADQENNGTVGTMLDMLPNFIYFVNADGLKVVVNNLLLPVNELLGHLEPMGVKVDFATIVEQIDITNVDWYAVQDLLIDVLDLYFPDYTIDFLSEFFIGQVVPFTSANGKTAYHMTYSEAETRRDMITCLISFVGDAVADERNAARLIGWIGEDIYTIIYRYISDNAIEVGMQNYDWQLTSYAGTGKALSPIVMGSIYNYVYGKYFTREMGEYMEANFPEFVDTMIHLLGIQIGESEVTYESLEEILDDFVGETVYKTEYLEMILAELKDLLANLSGSLDAELYEKIVVVVNTALGVDLTYWDDYTVAEITEGDRASFVNELLRMLKPFYPILAWLLTDEDIAFFHSNDGTERDLIVIDGAEGYAYGIIPVMEALGCHETTMTPAEFKAAAQNDPELLLRNVIDPILNKVDVILADPLNEIFDVLPGVIYFINCNGLDTAFQNIINAVLGVLANLEPAIGEVDIYELIGFDFKTINIENIIRQLLKDLETESGFRLEEVAMEAIKELTVGEVVEFTSKNGDTAYTMQYAEGGDRVDMITIVLRLALAFISDRDNVTVIKTMIKDDLNEDGYKFVCALLDNFADMAGNADGMDKILYTVYYIFYSAKAAADGVEDGYDKANDNYAFLNDLFEHSDVDFLKSLESSLGDFLDQNFEDILDRDELVPNGFIKFFQKLIDLFKQIIEWFKGLLD